MEFKNIVELWFKNLQDKICSGLEKIDSGSHFREDKWFREGGGGGLTRILSNGKIIERGGVNFSSIHGEAPEFLRNQLQKRISNQSSSFFATGVSIVIHPLNPEVPIIHMNVRYFEMDTLAWFGGGIDLTPHYIVDDDAILFHQGLRKMCNKHNSNYYPDFKKEADDYFFIKHRNETRGIGGIFFDQIEAKDEITIQDRFEFVKDTGEFFLPMYSELINRNKDKSYGENEIKWQRLRRGRYVEFNLVYDRGTKFGLETNGRTESILMSLPPFVQWEYDFKPEEGSREKLTLGLLKKGIDWAHKLKS